MEQPLDPVQPSAAAGAEARKESWARLTLLHGFSQNPSLVWTDVGLASWYGIAIGRVRSILRQLLAQRLIRPVDAGDRFRWSGPEGGATARHPDREPSAPVTASPQANILVVAHPVEDRARIGGWLEDAGCDVTMCSGPRGSVPCIGMRGSCPLAEAADAVVLDMRLEDDPLGGSIPGWQVLDVYTGLGLGVVTLIEHGESRMVGEYAHVVPLHRPAERGTLLSAVRTTITSHRSPSDGDWAGTG